jgi:hypothetical protein
MARKNTPNYSAYLIPFNVITIGVPGENHGIIWDYLPFYH